VRPPYCNLLEAYSDLPAQKCSSKSSIGRATILAVTLLAAQWSALVATLSASACGFSAAQPIGAGVALITDEGGVAPTTDGGGVASTTDGGGDAAPDPLAVGLVAYWKLDETGVSDPVVDSSGRGHNGVPVNGPLPSTSIPPVKFPDRASRSFDGTSQYILVANNQDMDFSGEITLAAWVYVRTVTAGCHYIVAHGYCVTPPGEVALRIGAPGCGGGTIDHYWAAGSWLSGDYSAIAPLYDLDLNVWLHIAGVYDGQTWHVYRNGEEVGRLDSTVGAVPVASDWAIGAKAPGVPPCMPVPPERYLDGLIDEVRIYRRALSPSEILELYQL
jgi:Concanavalin A-like lectin/glucanases superfamily